MPSGQSRDCQNGAYAVARFELRGAELISTGPSVWLSGSAELKNFDPLLCFDHTKLAGASIPRQSLNRICGDALYSGTAQNNRIEGRPQS